MEENGKERSKPPRKHFLNQKENIYLKTKKKKKKKNALPWRDYYIEIVYLHSTDVPSSSSRNSSRDLVAYTVAQHFIYLLYFVIFQWKITNPFSSLRICKVINLPCRRHTFLTCSAYSTPVIQPRWIVSASNVKTAIYVDIINVHYNSKVEECDALHISSMGKNHGRTTIITTTHPACCFSCVHV